MRQLNSVYTLVLNRDHGRVGHVFQGRYKALLVQKESYLLELARYIVLNPVRAGMVPSAKDWSWSSYRATAGMNAIPACLYTHGVLSAFAKNKKQVIERYKVFISENKHPMSPWKELKNQIYLESDAFVDKMQGQFSSSGDLREIPKMQRRPLPKPLITTKKNILIEMWPLQWPIKMGDIA